MELWFLFAVAAAVIGGIPSFLIKVAAKREYNSELFVLYGATSSVLVMVPTALVVAGPAPLHWFLIALSVGAGIIASVNGILRIYALRYIDTTIYFPLVKLLSPLLAIVFGVVFFAESFTSLEWLGMVLGILVPLLLITKHEHKRQNNLVAGLVFVLLTGTLSAVIIAINKYTVDLFDAVLWILTYSSMGVLAGSLIVIAYKQGINNFVKHIRDDSTAALVSWALLRGVAITISFGSTLYAFSFGGPLAIVHTIHSLYILIPIILAIVFYNEHWNAQKVLAIVLSIVALAFLQ